MNSKTFKGEKVVEQIHKKLNGKTYKPTNIILTEESIYVYTSNFKGHIKREDFMYYEIKDYTAWTTILLHDKNKNLIPVTCTERTEIITLFELFDQIKTK